MRRIVIRFLHAVVVLAVCSSALASAPAEYGVVEQFATRLSEGYLTQLHQVLSSEVVLVEHGLFVEAAVGLEARTRFRAWAAEGARLEVSFESASVDGAVIVTREQMWRDDVPEHLAPLRSTGVYVVDGGRIHSITRFLDADQRDGLMRDAIVGDWRWSVLVFSFNADSTYDVTQSGLPWDSGDFSVEGGALQFVSNDQSPNCPQGAVGTWWMSFTDADRCTLTKIEDMCAAREGATVRLLRIME
ncbi:MAG: hypothetical protein R6V57_16305 [Vicinamibacterales bacterium]